MKVYTNPTSDTVIWANKFNIHIYKQNLISDKKATLISDFFLIDEILPTNDSAYWITPSNMFSFVYGTPNIFLVKDVEDGTVVADCFFPGRINYGSYVGVFTDELIYTADKGMPIRVFLFSTCNKSKYSSYERIVSFCYSVMYCFLYFYRKSLKR